MNQQSLQPCPSSSETAEVQMKADSDCQTLALESIDNDKTAAKVATSTKSKAEMRAERRALQVS